MRNDYPVIDVTTCVTTTYDENGFLTASIEVPTAGEESGADPFELHHPYGFASRPPDATETDGCAIGFCYIGSAGHAIAFGDTRKTKKLALLNKGESMQYGPTGNFIRCSDDGAISMFTSSSPDGDVQTAKPSVFFEIRPKAMRFTAPWGRQWFDNTGFHVFHTSGGQMHLGAISGLPAPFDTMLSYIDFKAATVRAATNSFDIGNNPLTKDHLAHASPLILAIQQIFNALVAMANTPGAVGVMPIANPLVAQALGSPVPVPTLPSPLSATVAAMSAEATLPTTLPVVRSITSSS